jgi:hypothetical protein
MHITAATTLAERLMAQLGLTDTGWTFTLDQSLTRLGLCQYGPKVISLGTVYVVSADEVSVRDTLLHEIAHALVGPHVLTPTGAVVRNGRGRPAKTGHGWQWRVKAREIGGTGKSTGENPAATARHDERVESAKARVEHVAHLTTGPLQLGELVQTPGGKYKGLLVGIARVNGTIQDGRTGKAWRIPMTSLHRSGGRASNRQEVTVGAR